jgi:hypothetical protein
LHWRVARQISKKNKLFVIQFGKEKFTWVKTSPNPQESKFARYKARSTCKNALCLKRI